MATHSPLLSLSAADAAACGLLQPVTASPPADAGAPLLPDDAPVVDALGQVATAASLRAQLLRVYAGTSATSSAVANVSEAVLRVDTELELLRRRCFAARNAQWAYASPASAFDWRIDDAAADATHRWNPALVANVSVALRRVRHDAAAEREEKEATGAPRNSFSREREWPPRELTARAAAKPPKQRGGKRKAPAAIMEERSIFSKLCAECATQSSPLWRKLPRDKSARKKPLAVAATAAATGGGEVADGGAASQQPQPPSAVSVPMVDVCLACFLKLQRGDLFTRKKAERERKARELKDRATAERLLEKKRLKQQTQLLKKQQQQQQLAKSKKRQAAAAADVAPIIDESMIAVAAAAPATLKVVLKTDESLQLPQQHHQQPQQQQHDYEDKAEEDKAEVVAPEPKSTRRERKKSKKDKKKKKKKKRRAADVSDNDDGDDDDATPLPSPPQLSGQYEYADLSGRSRAARSYTTAFDDVDAEYEEEPVPQPVDKPNERDDAPRRARKAATAGRTRSDSVSTSLVTPTSSSLRKRKNSVAIPDEPAKTSARPSRAKPPSVSVAAAEEASTSATGSLSARKRARTKKESARERELRALGQYCPVCNAVYEEDDESTFVCCDSCEMWVHGSCDPTLTAASIAALSESSDKYICPMCSG